MKLEFLNETHLPQIMELQEIVVQNLPSKDLYYQNYETIKKQLKLKEAVIGAYCDGKLAGFHVMDTPDLSKDILATELDWNSNELSKVVKLGPTAVHPEYRGQNIIGSMALTHLGLIRKTDYYHVIATVSPYNYASMKSLFSQGFQLEKITFQYHNMTRFIMHLDLRQAKKEERYQVQVKNDDIKTQLMLLLRKFYGYGITKTREGFNIVFGCTDDGLI